MKQGFFVSIISIIIGATSICISPILSIDLLKLELWLVGLFLVVIGNLGITACIVFSVVSDYIQNMDKYEFQIFE